MPFKNIGQGKHCKKCAQCALFDELHRQATAAEEKEDVAKRKKAHIDQVKADRLINLRGNHMSTMDAQEPSADGSNKILKITIDGMDFACPHNMDSSAEFHGLWKPRLHMVGTTAWGYSENDFILNSDMPKGANMEATVIARTLDIVEKINQERGCVMPRHLVIAPDNTPKEAKNQHFLSFIAYLRTSGKFDSVEVEYMETGHTQITQHFSVSASKIASAPVLEDPEEFRDHMQATIPPRCGRKHVVEILPQVYDFKEWLDKPLNIHIQGLTSTHDEPNAAQVWRLIPRSLLSEAGFAADLEIECGHEEWKDLPPDPDDTILLLKDALHKNVFCQNPLLLCPKSVVSQIRQEDLKPARVLPLSETVINRFLATAEAIAKHPWSLMRGEAYLRKLCDCNCRGVPMWPVTEPLEFVHNYVMPQVAGCAHLPLHLCNASGARVVSVEAVGPQERARRLKKRQAAAGQEPPSGSPAQQRPRLDLEHEEEEDNAAGAPQDAMMPRPAAAVVLRRPAAAVILRRPGAPPLGPAAPPAPLPGPAVPPRYGCSRCRSSKKGFEP